MANKLRPADVLIGLAKIWGLWWVFVAMPFRGYARNVVYNYVLQHNQRDWLGRLWQREPRLLAGRAACYMLAGSAVPGHKAPAIMGAVLTRKASVLKFYLVVFLLWGWLDDDANEDTTSRSHVQACIDGEHKNDLQSRLLRSWLKLIDWSGVRYGNAFDLGDVRTDYPFFNFAATLLWNTRNSAMNFQYLWMGY